MSEKDVKNKNGINVNRRDFLKFSAASAGVLAVGMMTTGCNDSDSDSTSDTPKSTFPSKSAWKFGIMSDTQWTKDDDGENPASCAVDIINSLNAGFISHGVDFVIHVGDLTDDGRNPFTANNTKDGNTYSYTVEDAMGTRARYVQALYNNGIGYFPLRGNHDDSAAAATQFTTFFPQTKTGLMNDTDVQTAAYAVQNPDVDYLPEINRTKTTSFSMGSNFSSPSTALTGLSYSFDYENVRIVMLDQFTAADGTAYGVADNQQTWISSTLSSRASGTHAFCFSHKGLMTQDHTDILFGSSPASTVPGQDEYITSLETNGVKYHVCGHDHMHDRSYVATHDGTTAKVTQIVTSSNSSKFYTPSIPSNDETYCAGERQTMINQELYTIGYYIVTVDGDHVTVDFYSAPSYSSDSITTTPTLNFTKRESFGYSLNGQDFIIGYGESYTSVTGTSTNGTTAKILDGSNGNTAKDLAGRKFNIEINAGFYDADDTTSSDVLYLRGMDYTMGSTVTDVFALSMSYSDTSVTSEMVKNKTFGLAKLNSKGVWKNAIDANSGGYEKFVNGPWEDGYELGTWGVDTASKTVWAVINSNGYFAAVKNLA